MKEIKISFTISIPLKETDIHYIEEELLKKRKEILIEVLKRVIREIEEEAIKSNGFCKRCGLPLVKNGSEPKKMKTLLGTLRIDRVRLRCQRCKRDIYPLDEAIGLKGDCETIGVKERALWAAVEVSYEKAKEFLKKFTGLEISRNKIHALALEEGKRISEWEEERRRKVFERSLQRVVLTPFISR